MRSTTSIRSLVCGRSRRPPLSPIDACASGSFPFLQSPPGISMSSPSSRSNLDHLGHERVRLRDAPGAEATVDDGEVTQAVDKRGPRDLTIKCVLWFLGTLVVGAAVWPTLSVPVQADDMLTLFNLGLSDHGGLLPSGFDTMTGSVSSFIDGETSHFFPIGLWLDVTLKRAMLGASGHHVTASAIHHLVFLLLAIGTFVSSTLMVAALRRGECRTRFGTAIFAVPVALGFAVAVQVTTIWSTYDPLVVHPVFGGSRDAARSDVPDAALVCVADCSSSVQRVRLRPALRHWSRRLRRLLRLRRRCDAHGSRQGRARSSGVLARAGEARLVGRWSRVRAHRRHTPVERSSERVHVWGHRGRSGPDEPGLVGDVDADHHARIDLGPHHALAARRRAGLLHPTCPSWRSRRTRGTLGLASRGASS